MIISHELQNHLNQIGSSAVIVGVICLVMFVATLSISKNLSAYNVTKRRVNDLVRRREELKSSYVSTKRHGKGKKNKVANDGEFLTKVMSKLKLKQETSNEDLKNLLIAAGYRSKHALMKFTLAQLLCGMFAMIISLMLVKTGSLFYYVVPFVAVYIGSYLPKIMVTNAKQKRLHEIRKSLPDALDLMMICTEAGLTLTAAIDRVSKEMQTNSPILADELALTSVEIGFLPDRKKALEHFAKRVELQEVRSLTSILIQTEKYGTPVSHALRVLAKEFRTQRMLRAEEKAARLPALMTVPLIAFIFPTIFIVIIAPTAVTLMNGH